jgi:hypothetical protein
MSEPAAAANAESFQVPAPVWADLVAGLGGLTGVGEAARRLKAYSLAPAAVAVVDALPGAVRLIRLRLYRPDGSRRVDLYTGGAQAVMAELAGDLVSVSLIGAEFVPSWVGTVLCLGPRGAPAWESVDVRSPLMQALVDEAPGLVSESVRRLAGDPLVVAEMAEVAQTIQAGQWRLGTIAAGNLPQADDGQILAFLDTTAGLVSLECPENDTARLGAVRTYEIWNIIISMILPPAGHA